MNDQAGSLYSFGTVDGSGEAQLTSAEVVAASPGAAKITYTYAGSKLQLRIHHWSGHVYARRC